MITRKEHPHCVTGNYIVYTVEYDNEEYYYSTYQQAILKYALRDEVYQKPIVSYSVIEEAHLEALKMNPELSEDLNKDQMIKVAGYWNVTIE